MDARSILVVVISLHLLFSSNEQGGWISQNVNRLEIQKCKTWLRVSSKRHPNFVGVAELTTRSSQLCTSWWLPWCNTWSWCCSSHSKLEWCPFIISRNLVMHYYFEQARLAFGVVFVCWLRTLAPLTMKCCSSLTIVHFPTCTYIDFFHNRIHWVRKLWDGLMNSYTENKS